MASAAVTSHREVSQTEEEKQSHEEGEDKEELPEQPPPLVEEKPKEGKVFFMPNSHKKKLRI